MATTSTSLLTLAAIALLAAASASAVRAAEVITDLDGTQYYGSSGLAAGMYFDPGGPMPSFLSRALRPGEASLFRRGRLRIPTARPWTFGSGIWTEEAPPPVGPPYGQPIGQYEFLQTAPAGSTPGPLRADGFGIGAARFPHYLPPPRGGYTHQ